MSPVLFYDPVCRQPYDTRTLHTQALGGTEATLTRVADALDAFVIQHNRAEDWGRYRRPQRISGITRVIVTRDSRALPLVRERYPGARAYLWLHDQLNPGSRRGQWLAGSGGLLREMAVTAVCVSDSQRRGVEATLRRIGVGAQVRALTIYNPVDDALKPDGTPVDERKLIFFSSPNKGLNFTLDAFSALKARIPDLRLLVGNPGYRAAGDARRAGVEFLAAQPRARIHGGGWTTLGKSGGGSCGCGGGARGGGGGTGPLRRRAQRRPRPEHSLGRNLIEASALRRSAHAPHRRAGRAARQPLLRRV